jgi:hypothetical protein
MMRFLVLMRFLSDEVWRTSLAVPWLRFTERREEDRREPDLSLVSVVSYISWLF